LHDADGFELATRKLVLPNKTTSPKRVGIGGRATRPVAFETINQDPALACGERLWTDKDVTIWFANAEYAKLVRVSGPPLRLTLAGLEDMKGLSAHLLLTVLSTITVDAASDSADMGSSGHGVNAFVGI
jgi:hypothetical protein